MGFGIRIPALGIDTKKGNYLGANNTGVRMDIRGTAGRAFGDVARELNTPIGRMYLGANMQAGGVSAPGFTPGNVNAGAAIANSGGAQVTQNALAPKPPPGDIGGIPDFTNQYEAAAQKLNTLQKGADAQNLQMTMGANQAAQRSNLAMRGGLTAGANERLAQQGQQDFGNAYGELATKYGLGAAGIEADAIKMRQELALQSRMGADRAQAIRDANSGGFLGIGNWFK